MKNNFKIALQYILKYLARATLWKYRPSIIGITGSVGKTSAKTAITAVLKSERRVRSSAKNFNNEFGLPLTILSEDTDLRGSFFWLKIIVKSIWHLIKKNDYPEIIVLEYGIDRPGDMRYLLEIARPNVAVITAIGEIPVHVQFFPGPQDVFREKARLIEQLPAGGFAILNQDSYVVMDLKDRTRAHRMTFGFSREAEVRISSFATRIEHGVPIGINFKIEYAGSFVPVRLDGVFGRAQAYAAAIAASVGLIFGLNLVKISEALKSYQPPQQRFQLLPGIKESLVVDDSYNASPLSMDAALDTISDFTAKRKVGVLGDMLELGSFSEEAHRELGRNAANVFSIIFTVGSGAKYIAEGAIKAGMNKKNIHSFERAEEAIKSIQDIIKKGDLILVKGSRSVGLESVVEKLKTH